MKYTRIRKEARRGVMLLIVTLILTALTLSGAALLTLMKTEHEATSTRGRRELVHGVARSAVVYLIGSVEMTPLERERMGGLYDNGEYFCAKPLLTAGEGGDDTSRFTILSPKIEDARIEGIRYGLVDESSRLNLQAVLDWDIESPGAGRTALMKLPGMTATAADSILDWLDADEQARQYGAEARYYANANLPYSPRNATPVFLEELLLVRGVTRAQLYGSDENFTYGVEKQGATDAQQALGGSLTSVPTSGSRNVSNYEAIPWKELTTVFSAEKDVDPSGEARVNLNESNLEFLYQELESRVGADVARFVVLYRQYGPETPLEDAATPQNGGNGGNGARRASRYIGGQNGSGNAPPAGRRSGYFQNATPSAEGATAVATGNLNQAPLDFTVEATTTLKTPLDIVGARVVVNDVAYPSPIADSLANANVTRLMTLLDYASTSDSTTIVGRVNVNTAPRVVLSALPGLTAADVQRIIDDRPKMGQALPDDYRHAVWLYTKGVLSLSQMRSLYNKTTGRGDVYRGQIVGFLDASNEMERAEVVVDGTTTPPRQVFYKDLTTLGKGFSDATLLGGLTGSSDTGETSVSALDWLDASGVVDIQRDGSGYLNSSGTSLFDSLDAANGLSGGVADAATTNPADALMNASLDTASTDAAGGALTGELSDADSTLSATEAGAGNESTTSAGADAGDATSRRDRMLNALQSARQTRQTRNRGLGGESQETPTGDAATDENDAAVGGGADAGIAAGRSAGNNAGNAGSRGAGGAQSGGRNSASGSGNGGNAAPQADSGSTDGDRAQNALDALRNIRGGAAGDASGGGNGGRRGR